MGLFSKKDTEETIGTLPCTHGVLLPRWDNADDIGHEDRATWYLCEACGEGFSPQEADLLLQSMAERLPIDTEAR